MQQIKLIGENWTDVKKIQTDKINAADVNILRRVIRHFIRGG